MPECGNTVEAFWNYSRTILEMWMASRSLYSSILCGSVDHQVVSNRASRGSWGSPPGTNLFYFYFIHSFNATYRSLTATLRFFHDNPWTGNFLPPSSPRSPADIETISWAPCPSPPQLKDEKSSTDGGIGAANLSDPNVPHVRSCSDTCTPSSPHDVRRGRARAGRASLKLVVWDSAVSLFLLCVCMRVGGFNHSHLIQGFHILEYRRPYIRF